MQSKKNREDRVIKSKRKDASKIYKKKDDI